MKKPNVEVEVVDHSLTDRIYEHRFADDAGGSLATETRESTIPEEYMAKLEKHLGDAQAQVTIGADLTTSVDYGNKAGSFVSVKVTCNNDEADIIAVLDIAREIAESKVAENHERMSGLLDNARKLVAAPPSKGPSMAQATPGEKRINLSGKPPAFRR